MTNDISNNSHYWTGPVRCFGCGKEWVAVCEIPITDYFPKNLECPGCFRMLGSPKLEGQKTNLDFIPGYVGTEHYDA